MASGMSKSVSGTVVGTLNMVRHPIETAEALGTLATPLGRAAAVVAVAGAVQERVDKLLSGDRFAQGEVLGEVLVAVGEAVLGSKGMRVLKNLDGTPGLSTITKTADLADDALVCRGGQCSAGLFETGSGVTLDEAGRMQGVSVTSGNGATLEQLTARFKNKQVGVTTAGDIRRAGGTVTPDQIPNPKNPFHCTMCGLTPEQAEKLFTPTIPNPTRPPE
jgi:hypothetical protein